MNKRGWIRVVEAFMAILLIIGTMLFVLNKGYFLKDDLSEEVFDLQVSVLKEIQRDAVLRGRILEVDANGGGVFEPVQSYTDVDRKKNLGNNTEKKKFPEEVWEIIERGIMARANKLDCEAKICKLDSICGMDPFPNDAQGKDIFAQGVAISAEIGAVGGDLNKQLKLFCWEK